MPVALMFDGPSLGGFVCPATVPSARLWQMGQVSANDTVRFMPLSLGAPFQELLHDKYSLYLSIVYLLRCMKRDNFKGVWSRNGGFWSFWPARALKLF